MSQYDSIVIGAGHNGLVCAAYLARAGRRVVVLESADDVGGLAAHREFHPGFRVSTAHSIGHFTPTIVTDLRLEQHGYEPATERLPLIGLDVDGNHVVVADDDVSGVGAKDAAAYAKYRRLMDRFAKTLAPFWTKTMPGIGSGGLSGAMTFAHVGLRLRRLGKKDMQEFLRVVSLPARDLMDEFFESPTLKAALSWDGLIGAKLAPRSPNAAILGLLYRMSGDTGGAHTVLASGDGGLIESLRRSAEASGAEIRCGAGVDRILIGGSADGLAASGVQLASGEKIEAETVISAVDPKRTFLNLVGVEYLDIGFTNRIRRLRCDGYVAKLHLALDGAPEFAGLERADGRMIVAGKLDDIEFAFDDAKHGGLPASPVMEIIVPSLRDESAAPPGQHVLSAHVMYVPYKLKGGWTDDARKQMCERAIDTIERYAPGIRDRILHSEFMTPADLERQYSVTGGHWHHTEMAMDQMLMMRPTYGAAQYRTPIPGLILGSAGCHPGGDVIGAAGHNAAREVLR